MLDTVYYLIGKVPEDEMKHYRQNLKSSKQVLGLFYYMRYLKQ